MTAYPLSDAEQQQYDAIRGRIAAHGGLFATDAHGRVLADATGAPDPLDYVLLDSGRYLVDPDGRLWRFFGEGTSKVPGRPHGGGAPWRNNRVEMWNGRWIDRPGPDSERRPEKMLIAVCVDKRINGHPGMSQLQWYKNFKNYKHPHEGPDRPGGDSERSDPDGPGSRPGGKEHRRTPEPAAKAGKTRRKAAG